MAQHDPGPAVDPDLDKALSELLSRTAGEPIPPHLRKLAKDLEAALEQARQRRQDGDEE